MQRWSLELSRQLAILEEAAFLNMTVQSHTNNHLSPCSIPIMIPRLSYEIWTDCSVSRCARDGLLHMPLSPPARRLGFRGATTSLQREPSKTGDYMKGAIWQSQGAGGYLGVLLLSTIFIDIPGDLRVSGIMRLQKLSVCREPVSKDLAGKPSVAFAGPCRVQPRCKLLVCKTPLSYE